MSKYLCRVFKKNGSQDAGKVIHYCFKLLTQFQKGLVSVPPNLTKAQRADMYIRFYHLQNLQAPTEDLKSSLRECFRLLSIWESTRDLHMALLAAINLYQGIVAYESKDATCDDEEENVPAEPNPPIPRDSSPVTSPNPEPGTEATAAYTDQDRSPYVAFNQYLMSNFSNRQGSIRALGSSRLLFPLKVHADRIESLRRGSDNTLSLDVAVGAPAWCQDYSEACLKIDLAKQALDEALPNKQTERALAALSALLDGTFSLTAWFVQRIGILPADADPSKVEFGLLPLVASLESTAKHYASKTISLEEITAYLGQEIYTP